MNGDESPIINLFRTIYLSKSGLQQQGRIKKVMNIKKKLMQRCFREDLELHIDKLRQNNGNNNNGNTARRFFQNYQCSAEIRDIDKE